MQRPQLRILRLEPEMIGTPFDRLHLAGVTKGDVECGPYCEEEVPADRAVEDQHGFPGAGELGLHFFDDFRGIGHREPVIEDEQIDRSIDDDERHRRAECRGEAGAKALRLGALEQLVEHEGA